MIEAGRSTSESWLSREARAMADAWARGERVTAREVIDRHPGIDPESAIRLIFEETCLRRESGEPAPTDEVIARYPRWSEELRSLFDCDRLIRSPRGLVDFPEVGETLGPFRLLGELGRGASGRTYLASDPTLADRPVVVKVIPDDQDEHLALARLRHTHIVPLFSEHTFPEPGLRGLCMPYLGGASLAQVLDDLADLPIAGRSGRRVIEIVDRNTPEIAPDTPQSDGPFRRSLERATYVEAMTWIAACLADALHYAHARGLVHMDIKPSNVLITVDGQPMLLDFHLARGAIAPGEWVVDRLGGTPGWLSPEQERAMDAVAEGQPVPCIVDGRTDIYALGLLLARSLGAAPNPGDAKGLRDALRRVPGVSVGLADILAKCLAPDPKGRYDDAATLAEDLRRELNDLPLHGVRNRSLLERGRKWRRRHPGAVGWIVAGLVTAAAGGLALAAYQASYHRRLGGLDASLREGREKLQSGHPSEAIAALRKGLRDAQGTPGAAKVREDLDRELRIAERVELADVLHTLAERIRFRYGVELPSPAEAQSLLRACRDVWERRGLLLRSYDPEPDAERKIRTDLLELASIRADLQVRLAPPRDEAEARASALHLLDEAELDCGPSVALDARRRRLRGDADGGATPRARDEVPRSAWEYYELGRYALRTGQIAQADAEFRRALDLRPDDFWSNFYDGLCLYRLDRFADAESAFRACIVLQPDSAICHYNRARAYEALGRGDDARRGYARAIALDGRLVVARLNRGLLLYQSGRNAEAIADFEAALEARPDRETCGRLYFNLALAQRADRDRRSALASAEKAVGLGCREAIPLRDDLR